MVGPRWGQPQSRDDRPTYLPMFLLTINNMGREAHQTCPKKTQYTAWPRHNAEAPGPQPGLTGQGYTPLYHASQKGRRIAKKGLLYLTEVKKKRSPDEQQRHCPLPDSFNADPPFIRLSLQGILKSQMYMMPADGGPATPRTAQTERPYQRPARGRRGREPGQGGSPPSPPPPAALTRRRPTGPRPTPAAARQPPRHEYTPGGHAGGNRRQADARRGGGAGGRPPHPPPHPPQLGSHRSGPPPPRSRGDAPPPQKGPRRGGGGMRLDLLPRGSRPRGEPTRACRSNTRTRTVWGPRPT